MGLVYSPYHYWLVTCCLHSYPFLTGHLCRQTLAPDDHRLSGIHCSWLYWSWCCSHHIRVCIGSSRPPRDYDPSSADRYFFHCPLHQDWEPRAQGLTPEASFEPLNFSTPSMVYWMDIRYLLNLPYLTCPASKLSSDTRELPHCVCIPLQKMKVRTTANTSTRDPALAAQSPPQGSAIIMVLAALPWLVLADFPECNSVSCELCGPLLNFWYIPFSV